MIELTKLFLFSMTNKKNIVKIVMRKLALALIGAILMTLLLDNKDDFNGKQYEGVNMENLCENMYFNIITLLTIGYGDINPKSTRARFYVCVMALIGITILFGDLSKG